MTAQVPDTFRYRKREYAVAGISEGELFDPSLLDLKPAGTCSACWRGYRAVFAVLESRLVLDTLHVNLIRRIEGKPGYDRVEGPVINGVAPAPPKKGLGFFNNHYVGLNYHLEYSGGLLLADGFIESLYVHMGFHPAWKYKTVIELVFDAGVLKQEFDRSEPMAEIRKMVSKTRKKESSSEMPSEDEIKQFVERAFDRSYRR
jgi:hypothetical protein